MATAIYDLHTHSTASDGTLNPTALVQRAATQGVAVLALTDHDCTAGLAEASAVAANLELALVSGVEISVTWGGRTVHILGLGIDREDSELQAGLQQLRAYRDERAREIAQGLQKVGIEGALEGASCYAQGNILSRTHFARFLVKKGYAKSLQAVFKRYLVQGKPGHVAGRWATLEQAVTWIRHAGGFPVVAHPARYRLTRSKLGRLLGEFKECGGVALEVVSGSQPPEATALLLRLAQEMELLGSCGSDYHGPENAWIELGQIPPLPEGCKPVWSLWQ
ncbi:PHP domain-containing protein [Nitrosococcus wardiae]|uniref:PHP domain-containing protein n=1 Tax=Nitrosococcus wardiae TaxID=1814290 RepID=A0A4P7BZF1_9GAMM|nr:PHP domain-containing protein [Nitrosococcus wardiae]QBQ54594.1 PHP domain-containing protein [Nitrosococcus wardiae]